MGIRDRLRKMMPKRKVEPTYQDMRAQRQLDYIERSQTPEVRIDAMKKRINDRKARR